MDGHQIGAVVASSLTVWKLVVDVDVLPVEQRLATVRTLSLLLPNNLLSSFGEFSICFERWARCSK